jgi:hypothetical protein
MFGRVDAGMPRLDAFDQEFGPGPAAILRDPPHKKRLWSLTLIFLLLAVAIASALALAWPLADGRQGGEARSASISPQGAGRDKSSDQVTGLLREVAILKHEIRELTAAQRQAAETIAALQAAAPESRARSAYWYSDLAALTFGFAGPAEPGIVEPTSRRPATVRARPSDAGRRDNGAPLSLDPPQN